MDLLGSASVLGPLEPAGASAEIAPLVTALALGLVLGAVFFGGLWWTVRRGLTSSTPGLWFGLSALGRMAAVFAVMSQHPETRASELDARIDEYLSYHLISF